MEEKKLVIELDAEDLEIRDAMTQNSLGGFELNMYLAKLLLDPDRHFILYIKSVSTQHL